MRTKTLLLTAALTAAGALTSMAQVYSVNIVGYINLPLTGLKFSLFANQLDNKIGNTIAQLLPSPPANTVIYKFVYADQAFSQSAQFVGGAWTDGSLTLNPGEGGFIFPTADYTPTLVGEVITGPSTVVVNTGYQVYSGKVAQAGYLNDPGAPGDGLVDLGFGTPGENQQVYNWVVSAQNFATSHAYVAGSWNDAHGPYVEVGEAVLGFTPPASGPHTWSRNFSVGP